MFDNPGLTLGDQMFWIVDLFLKTMAAEACRRRIGALSGAIWNRVRKLEGRFLTLFARWKAGTLPKVRVRAVAHRSPRPPGSSPGAMNLRPASLLPRGLRWMCRMLPLSAGTLASSVQALLENHPEMRTFVAECPQVGRVLRPLCRMAGLRAPDYLARPLRVRVRKKKAPLPPHPLAARFPDTPPARAAAKALARMQAGLPVNVKRLSAVAYGYFVHPPRDDNCPPPEIGYGGRSFTPLPKDYVRPKDE